MRVLDFSFGDTALDVALDEALSRLCWHPPILRLWESERNAVVIGLGQEVAREVFVDNCRRRGIPVIRRFTGGGAVYHKRGNLNISLTIPFASWPEIRELRSSYRLIGGIIIEGLKGLGIRADFRPISDLAVGDRKVSGSAQHRNRDRLFHHATLMVDMELDDMSEILRMPSDMPEYRGGRGHADFVTTLAREGFRGGVDEVKRALTDSFSGRFGGGEMGDPTQEELDLAERLADEKYRLEEWNFRR
ncbi:MAG: lipoate--protein ligase family protein [bacterium]